MKNLNIFLALASFILYNNSARGQCNVEIPSNAITGSAELTGGSHIRWLCENDSVSNYSGGSNTYFIEDGARVKSSGGGSHVIYVKNGGTLDIDGGGGSITVFYEPNAIINNNLQGGGSNIFNLCDKIVFDYSNAPNSPCNPTFSTGKIKSRKRLKIFPNPSSKIIQLSGLTKKEDYKIYDFKGTEMVSGTILRNGQIDIGNFKNGLYFLVLNNNAFKIFKN